MFLSALLITPNISFGATSAEIQAQIQSIMAQIQALQQQLAQLQAQEGRGTAWCHTFNTNLRIGDYGEEVKALNTALLKEGVGTPFLTTEGQPPSLISDDGVFIENTASAVTGFQEKYRDEILTPLGLKFGTGFVGKSTRAKLNALYGCGVTTQTPVLGRECTQVITPAKNTSTGECKNFPTPCDVPAGWQKVNSCDISNTQPFIQVLSPNGGEQWQVGGTYQIKWNGQYLSSGGAIGVALQDANNVNTYIFTDITNDGGRNWTIPATIQPGSYRMRIWCGIKGTERYCSPDGTRNSSVEDLSDAPFSVIAAPTAPVGSLYIEPANSQLKVGGQLKLQALYQPPMPNCDIPGLSCAQVMPAALPVTALWSASNPGVSDILTKDSGGGITVSGISAGTTEFKAMYTLSSGTTITATTKVTVLINTAPSITVISPNGGEKWQIGSTQAIKWSSQNLSQNDWLQIVISSSDQPVTIIASQVPANKGSYLFTIPTLKPGSSFIIETRVYTGVACSDGGGVTCAFPPTFIVSDQSDAPFSIIASATGSNTGSKLTATLANMKTILEQMQVMLTDMAR